MEGERGKDRKEKQMLKKKEQVKRGRVYHIICDFSNNPEGVE